MEYKYHKCDKCGGVEFNLKEARFELIRRCTKCGAIQAILKYDPDDEIPF